MRAGTWLGCGALALAAITAGCTQIAASAAGEGLLAAGIYSMHDTSEETLVLPLADVERAARAALGQLNVPVVGAKRIRKDGMETRCSLEACLLGDQFIPVDVALERLSAAMTKVTVQARRNWYTPEYGAAEEILARILKLAYEPGLIRRAAPRGE